MGKRAKKRGVEIPGDETKEARFIRIVSPRVSKAVKAIETIGFCVGSNYAYTPAQVHQILGVLDKAFKSLDATFEGEVKGAGGFLFD